MLLSSESFRAYDTILLGDNFDYANFKPGIYGLKLSELRTAPGLGAAALVAIADLFSISEDVEILKFSLDKDIQVKYVLSPSFKLDKDEDGDDVLYFIMGDWKLDLGSLYAAIESSRCLIDTAVLEVPQTDKTVKYFAGFTFNLNPEKPSEKDMARMIRAKDSNKILSFILSSNRELEDSQQKLVELFNNSNGDFGDLYDALINSPYVGRVGEAFQYAQLKELPIGAYEISQIEWEDKEVTKKDTGEKARIQNWKFRAVSLTDKAVYYVSASKGSFFGKSITNTGDGNSPVLTQAGKYTGGKALMTLEAVEKVANGYSPKGRVFTNLIAGNNYVNA
ncbi:MAG: hypothetical protein ACKPA7_26700, partial [Sphaerospermopsis kisseleviana]